jgi:opacity protein-like surface antigen
MRRWPKEIAVFSCLLLLGAPAVHAQVSALGIRVGVNRAGVSATDFGSGVGKRTGLAIGLFAAFAQPGKMIVQPEVLYSQKGFTSLIRGGTATAELDYIEIPVLFKVRLSEQNRRLRPALILGPFVAFEVGCTLAGDLEGIGGGTDCEALIDGHGEMDAGFLLGAGVDYGLVDRFFLTADIRYTHGLLNLDWEDVEDRISTRTWSLMVGAGILLGR